MGQYRASTGLMLAALAQYWPRTGPLWHVYGEVAVLQDFMGFYNQPNPVVTYVTMPELGR